MIAIRYPRVIVVDEQVLLTLLTPTQPAKQGETTWRSRREQMSHLEWTRVVRLDSIRVYMHVHANINQQL